MAVFDETMVPMDIESEDYDGSGYKIKYTNGYSVEIMYDEWCESPRDWDNLGTMICWHRRYDLGDKQADSEYYNSVEDMLKDLEEDYGNILVLPLYLFDHSGLRMSTNSSNFRTWDSHGWDWGMVGFIYVSHENILKNWNADEITDEILEAATNCLVGEVETYDQYLSGEVYSITIIDENDCVLDGCGGYFGYDDAKEEGKHMAECIWNNFLSKTPVQGVLAFGD